jgi:hypothetical protein
MIKDRAYWEAWERQGPLRERLTPEQAFALNDAMYEYAKSLGVFPPADPLEGIETKIALAGAINFLPPLNESELKRLSGEV